MRGAPYLYKSIGYVKTACTANGTIDSSLARRVASIALGPPVPGPVPPTPETHWRCFTPDEIPQDSFLDSGFIAQSVNEIPELQHCVDVGEDGIYSLRYVAFIPFLVKGFQEQHAKIDALEARIAALETTSVNT